MVVGFLLLLLTVPILTHYYQFPSFLVGKSAALLNQTLVLISVHNKYSFNST
jgi:hypothetical protein